MDINEHIAFNCRFFEHAYEYKKEKGQGKSLRVLIWLFQNRPFLWCLFIIEKMLGFILGLRVPIYSDIVLFILTNLPGLPRMFGCYLRAVYYRTKLKRMEPNVIIEQGAIISHPEGVELHEFALIDKYVIIAADSAVIGRRVHLAPYVIITGGGKFIIEDYACMATGARAITSTESLKPGTRSSGPMIPYSQRDVIKGMVHIKKDAFVAVGVTILTNTIVEEGVVLSANIVSSGATDEWSIYLHKDSLKKPIRAKVIMRRKKLNLPDV
jgi:acetyltransferase-like isoleucine patch superfamily enzyme